MRAHDAKHAIAPARLTAPVPDSTIDPCIRPRADAARISAERRALEAMTTAIVNKILHLPTVQLRNAALLSDGEARLELVRELFELGEDEVPV